MVQNPKPCIGARRTPNLMVPLSEGNSKWAFMTQHDHGAARYAFSKAIDAGAGLVGDVGQGAGAPIGTSQAGKVVSAVGSVVNVLQAVAQVLETTSSTSTQSG
jgi:hypothetical protein